MDDFRITDARSFTGDLFDELTKADKSSGGGWQKTPKGFKRRRGGKWEYYYPHPEGKPGRKVQKKPKKDYEAEVERTKGKRKLSPSKFGWEDHGHGLFMGAHGDYFIKWNPNDNWAEVEHDDGALYSTEFEPAKVKTQEQVEKWAHEQMGLHKKAAAEGRSEAGVWRDDASPIVRKSEGSMDEFDQLLSKAEHINEKLVKAGGWEPIPGGKKGGQRRRKAGGGYTYRYDIPDYKMHVTSDTEEGARKQAEKTKGGIEKSADICKITPPVCRGNLGIERKDMPQFDDKANPNVVREYLDEFRREGTKVTDKRMAVGQLKATQKEINAEKVKGMVAAHENHLSSGGEGWSPGKGAIVVSSDGYVLDGHHRWAAMLDHDPSNTMPVHQVDAPIRELLKKSEKFYREGRGVKKAGFAAPSIGVKKSMTAGDAYVYAKWYERISKAISEAEAALADPFEALEKATLGEIMVGRMKGKRKKKFPYPLGKMKGKKKRMKMYGYAKRRNR